MTTIPRLAFVSIVVSLLHQSALAQQDLSQMLSDYLEDTEGVPALAAVVLQDGKITASGFTGVRKLGDATPITPLDKFHIGSCTKAMTATLAAVLVEEGTIQWESTIADFIKSSWVHQEYRSVTLTQLLSHGGGCPAQPNQALWNELFLNKEDLSPEKQREKLARGLLSEAPTYAPGSSYEYSNAGYAIAGLMLERAADKPWEKLMQTKLFDSLGITSAGFRAPGTNDVVDQPWGHVMGKPIAPQPYGDNPHAIGPAGTVHLSLEDWCKFALLHLQARPGRLLKDPTSFETLHQKHNEKGNYGLGWIVIESDGGRPIITHDGSNTMWYASIWLDPNKKKGVLVCLNTAGDDAVALCTKLRKWLMESE